MPPCRREDVQLALVETLAELNRLFALRGILAGCTATLVLQARAAAAPAVGLSACRNAARAAGSSGSAVLQREA